MSNKPFSADEVKPQFECACVHIRGYFRGLWWEFYSQDNEWSLEIPDHWFQMGVEDRQVSKAAAREFVRESLERYAATVNDETGSAYGEVTA